MKLVLHKDQRDCDTEATSIITASINKLLQTQDHVILAIPGGRSVSGIFKNLRETEISWGRVHIFMIDERRVPLTHKDSNFKQAKADFLDYLVNKGVLPKENLHPYVDNNKNDNPDQALVEYQTQLENLGGKYDILLLSSGEDGHIAALQPNHHSVRDKSSHFLIMNDSPKPPAKRMTMSSALVKHAQVCLLIFYGETKKTAYDAFMHDDVTVYDCPAKLVLEINDLYVVTNLE
jgi:6-phosphogluconolactonase